MENIVGDISFRCSNNRCFFKFHIILKGQPFYYPNFSDPEFTTALLSFACSTHINKCKYLIFVKLKNISQNSVTNWKGCHFTVSEHSKSQTFRSDYIFVVTFRNWYFIAKIGTKSWYFSAIFICFKLRWLTSLRISATK